MPELDKAKNALIDLGWSEYESRTYSALVQLGKATASKIAKNSNVPPNRVYQILSKLSERGVVHTTEARGSATEYQATDPEKVLNAEQQSYIQKIEAAKEALVELAERKQDTEVPITYTIYGKRELSTYLVNTLAKTKSSVFIAVDTLIELRHREILKPLNKYAEAAGIEIKVLTTQRGVNDEYEKLVAKELDNSIGLKISEDEFATIFMVIDHEIMIYTAYGFKDEDHGEIDYYGIYTKDKKTTRLLEKSFEVAYDNAKFFRPEDIQREKEEKEAKVDKSDKSTTKGGEQKVVKGPTASSGPKLG